jgi:hypothetical protein
MGLRLTRSDGHTNARAHASVTTGCSRRVELGLCSSFSGRDNPRTRCPRPAQPARAIPQGPNLERDWWRRSQPREHCSCLNRRGRPRRACLASASTRARHEAIAWCVCTSCRVAEVERRRRAQRRASSHSLTGTSSNERGLAQSGRPRRAKGRWKANRGGETVTSSSRKTGVARKGGVAGLPASSSMEDTSGRASRFLFTGKAGKAISAELEPTVARAW